MKWRRYTPFPPLIFHSEYLIRHCTLLKKLAARHTRRSKEPAEGEECSCCSVVAALCVRNFDVTTEDSKNLVFHMLSRRYVEISHTESRSKNCASSSGYLDLPTRVSGRKFSKRVAIKYIHTFHTTGNWVQVLFHLPPGTATLLLVTI